MTTEGDEGFGAEGAAPAATQMPKAPAIPAGDANDARHAGYTRPRRPHKTIEAVNDLDADESYERGYAAETSYTVSSHGPIGSHTYRKSHSDISHVKRELKYGQYLSVPKGNREIFGGRDRRHRQIIGVGVVAVAIIVLVLVVFALVTR